jgi:ADP-heptose:LPS heptosyltransferase
MGDVAMMIPSLRCLIKKYPETKITIVSKPTFRPFFIEFKNLDFFEVNFKTKHKGLKGVFKLFKELSKLNPTHIADLHSVLRTHLLFFLFKLKVYKIKRINKSIAERKKLFRKNNKIFKPLTPGQYRYSEVFNRLGFNIDLSNHEFSDPLQINSQDQIAHIDKSKKWIGIAPFASFNGKIYPLDLILFYKEITKFFCLATEIMR